MRDLSQLETFEIRDLLVIYTRLYNKMLAAGATGTEDFIHAKETFEKLRAEFAKRNPEAHNEPDEYISALKDISR